MGRFSGVHAFGYNSAESEPIWMKSGALWVHCWGLAAVDFGYDPHSSDSLRGRQIFCQVNNARNVSASEVVLPQKTQKFFITFPRLATSGRYNYARITDRRKFTTKWSLYWISSFHFYNNVRLFDWRHNAQTWPILCCMGRKTLVSQALKR